MKFNQNLAALPLAGMLFAPLTLAAREVPPNLKEFYQKVQNGGDCKGDNQLAGGFYDDDKKDASFGYCNKFMEDKGFYIKGPGNKLANMDIDCDGQEKDEKDRCGGDDDTQYETRYKEEVKKMGIPDLDTYIHPYVVLGNERDDGKATFLPEKAKVEPLSVVAVVCNDRLVYGVWGDTNGDDGDPLVGEASLAMADMCFGKKYDANSGYGEQDVLYIAFSGKEAVPGKAAKWDAKSYEEFEESLQELGDKLVSQLLGTSSNSTDTSTGDSHGGGSGDGDSSGGDGDSTGGGGSGGGDSHDGGSGDGDFTSGDGDSHDGGSGDGDFTSGDGDSHDGGSGGGDFTSGDGDSHDGGSGDGDFTSGDGDSHDGGSGGGEDKQDSKDKVCSKSKNKRARAAKLARRQKISNRRA